MEERKTIEIIDEHGINRKAIIMCGIDVGGTDYVIYSIERDSDNDNLFVSKLIKNNDGTNNMINIDDNSEKSKLTDIVKEMITQAVNNENDKLTGDVTLSNGDKVQVINVLINKEQKISVPKTYITTVKKSVAKVGNDFFKADVKPVVESIFEDTMPATPAVEPVLPEVPPIPGVADIPEVPSVPEVAIPAELSVAEPEVPPAAPEPVIPAVPAVEPILPEVAPAAEAAPEVSSVPPIVSEPAAPVVEPILPEVAPVAEVVPEAPAVPPIVSEPSAPAVEPILPEASEPVISETPVASEPVIPAVPVVEETAPTDSNGVFFDASAESNLNAALHEASDDAAIPVPNVEPIREFGVDAPVSTVPETSQDTGDNTNPPATSGFANNKFFMVIAIVFFLASCVFLGYEVYKYITIVK